MTAQDHTANAPENPPQTINSALNLHWKYYQSRHGYVLAAVFDSPLLDANPNFVQIDRQTYFELAEKMKS